MTDANLARHAAEPDAAFWQDLKAGSDAFAATAVPPRVGVCEHRYVFSPAAPDGSAAAPSCPAAGFPAQAS